MICDRERMVGNCRCSLVPIKISSCAAAALRASSAGSWRPPDSGIGVVDDPDLVAASVGFHRHPVAQPLAHAMLAVADEQLDGDEAAVLGLADDLQIRMGPRIDLLTRRAVAAGFQDVGLGRLAQKRLGQPQGERPFADPRRTDEQNVLANRLRRSRGGTDRRPDRVPESRPSSCLLLLVRTPAKPRGHLDGRSRESPPGSKGCPDRHRPPRCPDAAPLRPETPRRTRSMKSSPRDSMRSGWRQMRPRRRFHRHVQHEGHIRLNPAGGHRTDSPQILDIQSACVSLVDHIGQQEPVADHDSPLRQGRSDHLVDQLGSRCHVKEHLRASRKRDLSLVQQDFTQPFAQLVPPGSRQVSTSCPASQRIGERAPSEWTCPFHRSRQN
jgi:hypothetical protein